MPWLDQLKNQYSWSTEFLHQRKNQIAASERLVMEMNGRLSDITQHIKVFLDFRAEDVQALHSDRVDSMRAHFKFIKKQMEFLNQDLLGRYFDCIDEGLQNVTKSREPDYGKKWMERYSKLESEVMRHYGLVRSGEGK